MPGVIAGLDSAAYVRALRLAKPFLESLALEDIRGRARRIAERARSLAPVGSTAEGDPHPGAMRDDIGIKGEGIDRKGPFVDVGTREPYGLFVEFGTVNMTAEPFMRPAIAAESGQSGMASSIKLAPRAKKPKK